MITVGSLCSGYEGISAGLQLAGWPIELAWAADNDPDAAKVLAAHHPNVPNLGDISTVDWTQVPTVNAITAGFPCKNISCAGGRAGMGEGTESGVWSHVAAAINVLRPSLVIIENVRALLSTAANRDHEEDDDGADCDLEPEDTAMGDGAVRPLRAIGAVLGDLVDIGFDAEWTTLPASAVGAHHRRERVFILAWPANAESHRFGDVWSQVLAGMAANPVRGAAPDTDSGTVGQRGRGRGNAGGDKRSGVVDLLPTPGARLGDEQRGAPSSVVAAGRIESGRRNLDDAVALLPTPRATDGTKGGPNQRGSSGDLMLPSAVMDLLPTPTVADSRNSRNATAGRTDPKASTYTDGWTLSDVAYADRWGRYGPAIARWEAVTGRPAPDPTEPGSKGNPRLSPAFVEFLMGLLAGHVTAHVGRNGALKVLGNGVVPQQCAHAVRLLVARVAPEFETSLQINRKPEVQPA